MAKIVMRIGKDNKVTVVAEGYKGEACLAATAPYLKRLGGEVLSDVPTAEMHEVVQEEERAAQG